MTTVVRPQPSSDADWHSVIVDHLDHDLIVHGGMSGRLRVVVQCVSYDGRASLTFWSSDTWPKPVPTAESGTWRPGISMALFFLGRSVACRTCQMPIAR